MGLEKKTTVSKALAESSNFGENRTLGPALMLQASCIYLGIITPCPETFHPLHLHRRLITPCPTANAISTKIPKTSRLINVSLIVSLRRKWQPTPVLLPGESHGGRSLVGYSPWGLKELDMTERLYLLTYLSFPQTSL